MLQLVFVMTYLFIGSLFMSRLSTNKNVDLAYEMGVRILIIVGWPIVITCYWFCTDNDNWGQW